MESRLLPPMKVKTEEAAVPPSGEIKTPNLKMFRLDELRSATRNFRPDTVLGEGGFGRVFRGYLDEKTLAPLRSDFEGAQISSHHSRGHILDVVRQPRARC
ncbi:hypothetical protein ACS0TY_011480 [Phlomoides rotata]